MMARVVLIGLALIAAALMATAAPVALAQEPPLVTVTTFVQREGDTIGDPITIFITLSHPPGAEIVLQPDALALGALESAVPQIVAEESPDPTRTTFALRTRAFVTGVLCGDAADQKGPSWSHDRGHPKRWYRYPPPRRIRETAPPLPASAEACNSRATA